MDRSNFEYLWNETYCKAYSDIINFCKKSSTVVTAKEKNSVYNSIWKRYNYYRRIFHTNYFYGRAEDGKYIDVHKICACFAAAILDTAPIEFPIEDELPWFVKASNCILAFDTSIYMLHFFMIAHYKNNKPSFYEKANQMKRMFYPLTSKGHDSYRIGRIKALALREINNDDFDLLAYADMLYWIEHFNRQIIEDDLNVIW